MASPRIRNHQVSGNLVDDPKMIQTPQGRTLATFTLAENTRVYDNQSNQWADGPTVYYDVAIDANNRANGNLAQNVTASLKKGQYVNVEGDLTNHAYLDRENNPQVGNRIWASDVTPSLKFATVEIHPNNAQAQQGPQAQMNQGPQATAQAQQAPEQTYQQPNHEQAAQFQAQEQPDFSGPSAT